MQTRVICPQFLLKPKASPFTFFSFPPILAAIMSLKVHVLLIGVSGFSVKRAPDVQVVPSPGISSDAWRCVYCQACGEVRQERRFVFSRRPSILETSFALLQILRSARQSKSAKIRLQVRFHLCRLPAAETVLRLSEKCGDKMCGYPYTCVTSSKEVCEDFQKAKANCDKKKVCKPSKF